MLMLYDNVCTFAIAAVGCTFAWLFGGTVASALRPVMPWLFVLLFEAMLCFPQRLPGETTYAARERVWSDMRKDPLVWTVVVFILILAIPFLNVGLCPVCDYAKINIENIDPAPTIPFLPYCVNRLHHYNVFIWFLPALTAMLAAKHALLKRGKRTLLTIFIWNGVLLALIGMIQQITDANAPLWADLKGNKAYFFSTFGYPNMGGDYFTTLFALAMAMWRWNYQIARNEAKHHSRSKDRGLFWRKYLMLVPAVIFFLSAMATLSRASIMLVSVLAVVFFLHTMMTIFRDVSKASRFKSISISVFVMALIATCAVMFAPESIQKEVDTLNTSAVLDRVTGRGQYHARVAIEVWKDNFLFGCGGWGYQHFCLPKMTDDELKQQQKIGGINVHNDYLQFLAEHGAVGFGLLVAMVFMLLRPIVQVWRAMINATRFISRKELPPKPITLFVLPAPTFFILLSAAATFIHGFGDCPLRSPAVLTLFFVSLACADGFVPYMHEITGKD